MALGRSAVDTLTCYDCIHVQRSRALCQRNNVSVSSREGANLDRAALFTLGTKSSQNGYFSSFKICALFNHQVYWNYQQELYC